MSIRGFTECVAIVRDVARVAQQYVQLSGWTETHRGPVDARLLQAWGLPEACSATESLLLPTGEQSGGLRLLELHQAGSQIEIRSNPQSWDSGGILDLNIRVDDLQACSEAFSAAGWRGPSDPVTWTFGDKRVAEWLSLGPDGLALALIERIDPPLPPGSIPGGFGAIFNSTQVVADMAASLAFYEGVLGFSKFVHLKQPLMPEPHENVLGIPHNLISQDDVEIAILSPSGDMDGSIELIQMHGLEGRDFSARAAPPNIGMLALRFPVSDVQALHKRLCQQGVSPAYAPVTVELAGIGRCSIMAVQAPEGAWLEFYQCSSSTSN